MLPDRANMYSDDDASSGGDSGAAPDDDQGSESQTALIPKGVFGSEPKPGDSITLKAVRIEGDEVVCQKADGGEGDEEQPPPDDDGGDQSPQAPGGLSSMLSD